VAHGVVHMEPRGVGGWVRAAAAAVADDGVAVAGRGGAARRVRLSTPRSHIGTATTTAILHVCWGGGRLYCVIDSSQNLSRGTVRGRGVGSCSRVV
jgi:hypothetical protein